MDIYPAIDLIGGKVVRLTNGNYETEKVYSDSPIDTAKSFEAAGAGHIHLVDLDAARSGGSDNSDIICEIASRTGLFVETGGGIRDEEKIRRYLGSGIGRVILGTIAVKRFDFTCEMAAKYGERIAVGVDASDSRVAVSGWYDVTEIDSETFCKKLAENGISTVIYTDISKDGRLSGINSEIYKRLAAIDGLNIIASGGVSSLDDIRALASIPCCGAIIGKALYEGRIDLKDALKEVGKLR